MEEASTWTLKNSVDWSSPNKLGTHPQPRRDDVQREPDPRDRLQAFYFAATEHDKDEPVHLLVHDSSICVARCASEYCPPGIRLCPTDVYGIPGDTASPNTKRLQINAANCGHRQTGDIQAPYQVIDWVTPEGGAGPNCSAPAIPLRALASTDWMRTIARTGERWSYIPAPPTPHSASDPASRMPERHLSA